MKPTLNGRAALLNNPMSRISSDGTELENVFGILPNAMYKAANLNLTFDDSEVQSGIQIDSEGNFDGIIGRLQRNESDFSVFTVPLEVMLSEKFDHPVKVISHMDMTYYHIVSHPKYNRTEAAIHSDLEESILVMSPVVVVFYMFLFLVTQLIVTKICNQLLLRPRAGHVRDSRDIRVKGRSKCLSMKEVRERKDMKEWNVAWEMVRHVLKQGLRMQFETVTQVLSFFIFECAVGILLVFLLNFMSAELVTYKKPLLLNTLEQVWNARDQFNISFVQASGAPGVFKYSPVGSLKQKLWTESVDQWARIERRGERKLQLFPSDLMLESPGMIKRHHLALMCSALPLGIILGIECSRDEKDLVIDPYSNLYMSKESFMTENMVQITSHWIDPRLESRLVSYFFRLAESGLQDWVTSRGHEMTLANIPLLASTVSQSCLNVKAWSDENNVVTSTLKLDDCKQFLKHISMSLIVISATLISEFFISWWNKRRKKVFFIPVRYQERKRMLNPRDSKKWVEVQRRRMMTLKRLRDQHSPKEAPIAELGKLSFNFSNS